MKLKKALAIVIAIILMLPMALNIFAVQNYVVTIKGNPETYITSAKTGEKITITFDVLGSEGVRAVDAAQYLLEYDDKALEDPKLDNDILADYEQVNFGYSPTQLTVVSADTTGVPRAIVDGLAYKLVFTFKVKDASKLTNSIVSLKVDNEDMGIETYPDRVRYMTPDDKNLSYVNGQVIINPSDDPGNDTHSITVGNIPNGTFRAPQSAKVGDRVTITAVPDNGYQIASSATGAPAKPTITGVAPADITGPDANNGYTFVMPNQDVTITGSGLFTKIPEKSVTVRAISDNNVKVTVNGKASDTVGVGSTVNVEAKPETVSGKKIKVTKLEYVVGTTANTIVENNVKGSFTVPDTDGEITVRAQTEVKDLHNIEFNKAEDGTPMGKAQVDGVEVTQAAEGDEVVVAGNQRGKILDKINSVKMEDGTPVNVYDGNKFRMPNGKVIVDVTLKNKSDDDGPGGGTTTYTLTYNTNGGSAVASEKVEKDITVTLDATTTKEGHNFVAWCSDAALENEIKSIKMDGNKTVYAKWEAVGGNGGSNAQPRGEGNNVTPDAFDAENHGKFLDGYEDGTVRPNANITRAEVASMIYRLLKESVRGQIYTTTNKFSDVPARKWYNVAVSSMANGGYIAGYPDGTFGGERNITRAEFVTMLANFLDAPIEGSMNFSDVSSTHWAYKNIVTAVSAGWVSGYEDGTFRPNRELTRAEAIAVLNRVLNRNPQSEQDMAENMKNFSDNQDSGKWFYLDILEAANAHDFVRNENGTEKWV